MQNDKLMTSKTGVVTRKSMYSNKVLVSDVTEIRCSRNEASSFNTTFSRTILETEDKLHRELDESSTAGETDLRQNVDFILVIQTTALWADDISSAVYERGAIKEVREEGIPASKVQRVSQLYSV